MLSLSIYIYIYISISYAIQKISRVKTKQKIARKYWKCVFRRLRSDFNDVRKKFTDLSSIINIT